MNILKKYETFLKYIVVAILSFLIDISLFNLFFIIFKGDNKAFIATVVARVISSIINFILNKDKVFKSSENTKIAFIKYVILVIVQMFISAFLTNTLSKIIKVNINFIKIPVDIMIFVANYFIQKIFIFKRGKHEN